MATRKFIRDNGDEVETDFSYRISDDIVEIMECAAWLWADRHDASSPIIDLTGAEIERLEEEVTADPNTWEYGDDY